MTAVCRAGRGPLHPDPAALGFDQPSGNRQAKADADATRIADSRGGTRKKFSNTRSKSSSRHAGALVRRHNRTVRSSRSRVTVIVVPAGEYLLALSSSM